MAKFKVIGNHPVHGVLPGRSLELDPDDPRTRALVKAGHVQMQRPQSEPKADANGGEAVVQLP